MRKVIANTTPIIALADIGQLELLHELYKEITIPTAVFDEIISEPAKSIVNESDWIIVDSIKHPEQKKFYRSRLHDGEVEVVILAQEQNADLAITRAGCPPPLRRRVPFSTVSGGSQSPIDALRS